MKKTLFLGFLMLLSSLAFSSNAFAQKFDIASFNISSMGAYKVGISNGISKSRLESIRKLVSDENLDFIGLQEVDSNNTSTRNIGKDILYDVSKGILPYQIYGQTSEGSGGVYGNAMLTKTNVRGELVNFLPRSEYVKEHRAYQRVVLEKNGYFIAVYNTHLSYEKDALRKQQIATLLSVLENEPIPNKILMGDFNLDSTDELKLFENKGYKIIKSKDGKYLQTYPTYKTSKQVKDVILVSSNIKIISGSIKGTSVESDHHMLRATIDVSEKGNNNLRFENNIMFTIGKNGFLQKAEEYVNNKRSYVWEYYPNALYGKHGNQIRYRFTIGKFANVEYAFRKKQGTFTVDQEYSYYPNAKYGIHGSKLKATKVLKK